MMYNLPAIPSDTKHFQTTQAYQWIMPANGLHATSALAVLISQSLAILLSDELTAALAYLLQVCGQLKSCQM